MKSITYTFVVGPLDNIVYIPYYFINIIVMLSSGSRRTEPDTEFTCYHNVTEEEEKIIKSTRYTR